MRGRQLLGFLSAWLVLGHGLLAQAPSQQDRRGRTEPGLVLNTTGRTGTCDALAFTADGRYLLAAGDDKVVRLWPISDKGIDASKARTLRWSIWHEQRGNIYAFAVDATQRRIAVGGKGVMTGMVVIIDMETGETTHALTNPADNDQVIRALAFQPAGNAVAIGTEGGGVWLWNLDDNVNSVRRLPINENTRSFQPIRLLLFENDNTLLVGTGDGRVLECDLSGEPANIRERFRFFDGSDRPPAVYRIAVSGNHDWLAAAAWDPRIEIRSRDGKHRRDSIVLSGRAMPFRVPRAVALDQDGARLAVGVRRADVNDYFHGTNDHVEIHDLRDPKIPVVAGPPCTYHVEGLAFSRDGGHLASAGGDNHEVTLWDIAARKPIGTTVSGPGQALWGVGLSANNRHLGFRTVRASQPSVNDRGSGDWHVFDLDKRKWQPSDSSFAPVSPRESATGWKIKFPKENVFQWSLVAPNGAEFGLALDERSGGAPLCYTFLDRRDSGTERLAIGQYFGTVSVFDLTEREPKILRGRDAVPASIYTAHQGEIMAIAPSADMQWLVTASRDQTISALSVTPWPSGSELGALLAERDDSLFVQTVDIGSPAWEAGLIAGDEVVLLAYDRVRQYDAQGEQRTGTVAGAVETIRGAAPGKELVFYLRRGNRNDVVRTNTTIRRRPHWRFFPTKDRDWVLWLWRNSYYETSTNGDYLVGWHVNQGARLEKKPKFYAAEKLRGVFQSSQTLDRLLWEPRMDADRRLAAGVRPPDVRIDAASTQSLDENSTLTLNVHARALDAANPDQLLARAELWIEDHRYKVWPLSGHAFAETIQIPAEAIRTGKNQITLQSFNAAESSNEASVSVDGPKRAEPPQLFGLAIGVADYRAASVNGQAPANLKHTTDDARAMRAAWLRQSGRRFRQAEVSLLLDEAATRDAIISQLRQLANRVHPDDLLVLFLGGHGYDQPGKPGKENRDRFVFCCPNFDLSRPDTTGLTSQTLMDELAAIRCRKLVLLDVCHAGLAANPVRGLTPGGKGPTILASCDKSEAAVEDDTLKHGLFSYAVMEALGNRFTTADKDQSGKLDANELFMYAETRLPQLLKELKNGMSQNPTRFPLRPDTYPLAEK